MGGPSPFLHAGDQTENGSLAFLQLRRDQLVPVTLDATTKSTTGYAEGIVTNTRFGSFPHSTLVCQPWGSQILASKVDTGSRGKRKRAPNDDGEDIRDAPKQHTDDAIKAPVTADNGFIHLLQPTPESWTVMLPHRTQVVYTPDSSYILQRLRAQPGTRLIEAGAGSGSFTHASTRAVFDGENGGGHVYSFEYHEPRVAVLQEELRNHGLDGIATVTHRDVYTDGFTLEAGSVTGTMSPRANAVFLDLPAPWMALRHLTRRRLNAKQLQDLALPQGGDVDAEAFPSEAAASNAIADPATAERSTLSDWISPLDPSRPVHVCTFTPCIEQVQSTATALRKLGWVEIEMVEIQNRRLDIRRERVGLSEEGLRGADSGPKDVNEAVERLRFVEGRFKTWGDAMKEKNGPNGDGAKQNGRPGGKAEKGQQQRRTQKQQRQEKNRAVGKERKLYKEGTLVHRTEAEVKAHTSYLTFATLPVEWTEEDERRAMAQYPVVGETESSATKSAGAPDDEDDGGVALPAASS